jgi:hypothetical protein
MINFMHKILYAIISCGMLLGLFPVNGKEKEQKKAPETPEVTATPENQPKNKSDEEQPENADDFEMEDEEEESIEEMPQPNGPKRRKDRDGDGSDA